MARNHGKGSRTGRTSQAASPSGQWVRRNSQTGRYVRSTEASPSDLWTRPNSPSGALAGVKASPGAFRGVRREDRPEPFFVRLRRWWANR